MSLTTNRNAERATKRGPLRCGQLLAMLGIAFGIVVFSGAAALAFWTYTDASNARELMLTAMREHSLVLDAPAPTVTLDSVDHTAMNFVATCFVDGPRAAGGVKSDLLFEILKRLRDAAIPLIRPQDMVIRGGAAPDAASESTP